MRWSSDSIGARPSRSRSLRVRGGVRTRDSSQRTAWRYAGGRPFPVRLSGFVPGTVRTGKRQRVNASVSPMCINGNGMGLDPSMK